METTDPTQPSGTRGTTGPAGTIAEWVLGQQGAGGPAPDLAPGRYADRDKLAIIAAGFVDALRAEGLNISIGATLTYIQALAAVASVDRSARYWCGRTTLITRAEDFGTYHRVFGRYWTGIDLGKDGEEIVMTTQVVMDEDDGTEDRGDDETQATPDVVMRYSAIEVLTEKDFAEYTDEELAELSHLMTRMRIGGARRPSRRARAARRVTPRPDLKRTIRKALAREGEPIERAFKRPSTQPRRVVLLIDISGSMESYARALLRFVHATVLARGRVEAFTLGTRLTRLTRELATLDPDRALDNASAAVDDWSGGTRLGSSIQAFNDEWGVRGMARGAVVVVLSDGWDRGDPALMDEQMARLGRVAHRIVWANPLKATDGYQPLARGMAAALPHVDEFIEGHSLGALIRLAEAINRDTEHRPDFDRLVASST